jgi:hypothetical protein
MKPVKWLLDTFHFVQKRGAFLCWGVFETPDQTNKQTHVGAVHIKADLYLQLTVRGPSDIKAEHQAESMLAQVVKVYERVVGPEHYKLLG